MMHPDIQQYFEEYYQVPVEKDKNWYWVSIGGLTHIIAMVGKTFRAVLRSSSRWDHLTVTAKSSIDDNAIVYMFNNGLYAEEDMLKILKLKAFL